MKISREDLNWAADQGIITHDQLNKLVAAISERQENRPGFNLVNVMYYTGALITILAMSWFMSVLWEPFGGQGIFILSCVYAFLFVVCGKTLWFDKNLKVPGGLLITVAVCMAPIAMYGLQRAIHFWPFGDPGNFGAYNINWADIGSDHLVGRHAQHMRGKWLLEELATIVAGLAALRYFAFPFLTAPIAFSLWLMSLELVPSFFNNVTLTSNENCWVSIVFGLLMLFVAYAVDKTYSKSGENYGHWLYRFATLTFWGGLTCLDKSSDFAQIGYLAVNCLMMILAPYVNQKMMYIYGLLGSLGMIGMWMFEWTQHEQFNVVFHSWIIFVFGALITFVSCDSERRKLASQRQYLSANYFVAALTMFSAVYMGQDSTELTQFLRCLFDLFAMLLSVFLQRQIFLLLGSLGLFCYIWHLSYELFKDSMFFPVVLSGIGIGIIFVGVHYQKNKDVIHAAILQMLPEPIRQYMPGER